MVGGEIKFHVGQTFDNAVQMRDIFKEYAIQQGVVLNRVKNDNVRQTYKRLRDGCPLRAHGSRRIDRMTFMIKTLGDEHECHRVYNNKEAKVKCIAFKFENLVKTNPSVSIKEKSLSGVSKDHAKFFGLLRRYAYMVNQSNSGSAVHIRTQEIKDECKAWISVLPPMVNAKILKNNKESRLFIIIAAGNGEYEMLGPIGGYGAKLKEYSCQCGYWKMSGIPYSHAMATISHYCGKSVTKDKISDFVHQSLSKSAYLQTYNEHSKNFKPEDMQACIEGENCIVTGANSGIGYATAEGQTEHLIPPPHTIQPGKPKTHRKREPDEPPKGGRLLKQHGLHLHSLQQYIVNLTLKFLTKTTTLGMVEGST
ncbi:hypothetical protein Q3G72_012198 [Acer saccharum]|nr:hypothetical protein Q3G72_012198 [Acer saccharum]